MFDTPLIVTIDGPAGVGKGTLARSLAARLGLPLLDSGSIYRLVALVAEIEGIHNIDDDSAAHLLRLVQESAEISFSSTTSKIEYRGKDVSGAIRTEAISQRTSQLSVYPSIRSGLTPVFRTALASGGIAEGRDMGSVVFPDATVKVFLTASLAERARRRFNQLTKDNPASLPDLAQVTAEIAKRDERDSSRAIAPLSIPSGAVVIDSTELTSQQVFTEVCRVIEERLGHKFGVDQSA